MLIKIDDIKINPGRREAAPEDVQRLSESIAEVGMMNPITVDADYKDGNVRQLTGGNGSMSIRQWHAYPNIFPRELYSDETITPTDAKFVTL